MALLMQIQRDDQICSTVSLHCSSLECSMESAAVPEHLHHYWLMKTISS